MKEEPSSTASCLYAFNADSGDQMAIHCWAMRRYRAQLLILHLPPSNLNTTINAFTGHGTRTLFITKILERRRRKDDTTMKRKRLLAYNEEDCTALIKVM